MGWGIEGGTESLSSYPTPRVTSDESSGPAIEAYISRSETLDRPNKKDEPGASILSFIVTGGFFPLCPSTLIK